MKLILATSAVLSGFSALVLHYRWDGSWVATSFAVIYATLIVAVIKYSRGYR